jgi:hypothetical protein
MATMVELSAAELAQVEGGFIEILSFSWGAANSPHTQVRLRRVVS